LQARWRPDAALQTLVRSRNLFGPLLIIDAASWGGPPSFNNPERPREPSKTGHGMLILRRHFHPLAICWLDLSSEQRRWSAESMSFCIAMCTAQACSMAVFNGIVAHIEPPHKG